MKRNWIFLRGLSRSSGHWGPFVSEFKNKFPLDEVELIDAAGNGTEFARRSLPSIQKNVDDIRARSKFVGEGRPISLLTISLGGMMGVDWATRYPNEVKDLILINTSDRRFGHVYERMTLPALAGFAKVPFVFSSAEKEKRILDVTVNGWQQQAQWVEAFTKMPRTSTVNTLIQLYAAMKSQFPINKPPCQVVVVSGGLDQLADPVCSERLAKAWNCPHLKIQPAGHDVPLTHPTELCDLLSEQLSRPQLGLV